METPDDMLLFAKVVELKSFTRVAEVLHLSRSLISKRINRLENKLGVQLINRTTRRLSLTEAGHIYYEYCQQIDNTIHNAEDAMAEFRLQPRGSLSINAPVSFGQFVLPTKIFNFLQKYPEISVNLSLNDQFVDVVRHGYDIVIRIGEMKNSSLMARQLATTQICIAAHKSYLNKYGEPKTPQELLQHNCLTYHYLDSDPNEWRFKGSHGEQSVKIKGNFSADNGMPLLAAAQAGIGIAIMPEFTFQQANDKSLVKILSDFALMELGVFAVYPNTRQLPIKTRLFIDYMVEQFERESELRLSYKPLLTILE